MDIKKREQRSELLTVRIRPSVMAWLELLQGEVGKGRKRPELSQADIVESLIEQAYVEQVHGKILKI